MNEEKEINYENAFNYLIGHINAINMVIDAGMDVKKIDMEELMESVKKLC